MEFVKGFALIAVAAFLIGIFNKQDILPVPGKDNPPEEYTPIRDDGPIPSSLFGLQKGKDGTWTNSSGQTVYRQARVYAGGSKPRPLPVRRVDGCKWQKEPVIVRLDSNRYPVSALHIYIGARNGVPETLHINRDPGYDIRSKSLQGIPSNSTFDRDESPFALSNEAAVYNREEGSSDIAYIPFADNRGSGSSMGNQLSSYCDGQSFKIALQPAR